ncbi:MAG: hypothetical protein SGJ09_09225 [Phycisphaerae bacterium]|nr:hypothetical protein [Phycisphaerae bacterium]
MRLVSAVAGLFSALFVMSNAGAEIANLPRAALVQHAAAIVVGECTKVESKAETSDDLERRQWSHRFRVDTVERDPTNNIKAGDEIVLMSWTAAWKGAGDPPPFGSGHRGMPAVGERRRVYIGGSVSVAKSERTKSNGDALILNVMLPNGWQLAQRSVVFIGAEDEYRSEVSMPLIAECLARDGAVRSTIAFPADPATHALDVARRDHIEKLDALRDADLAVVFMRWRELEGESWSDFASYLRSGQPIVGLRTSTHMIRTKEGAADRTLDNEVPARVFGQRWISHAGNATRTRVLLPEGDAAQHPILRGIRGGFEVPSWLYDVEPLPKECTVLLWGEVVDDNGASNPRPRQPLVWVRQASESTPTPFPASSSPVGKPARRMAFTTLGHPGDFANVEVRRLVEQMALWAMGDESAIPAEGVKAEPATPYVAPATR